PSKRRRRHERRRAAPTGRRGGRGGTCRNGVRPTPARAASGGRMHPCSILCVGPAAPFKAKDRDALEQDLPLALRERPAGANPTCRGEIPEGAQRRQVEPIIARIARRIASGSSDHASTTRVKSGFCNPACNRGRPASQVWEGEELESWEQPAVN